MEITHALGIKIVDTKSGFRVSVTHTNTDAEDESSKSLEGRFYRTEIASLPAVGEYLKTVLREYSKDAAPSQTGDLFKAEL